MRFPKEKKGSLIAKLSRNVRLMIPLAVLAALFSMSTMGIANAQSAGEKRASGELARLQQEKEEVRTARQKLLQEEGAARVQAYKPVDRIRKQLDAQETDLYAECSGKDLKIPQYSFCATELARFNETVRYFNERLEDLKGKLVTQRQQYKARGDELDRKEREIDRKIGLLRPQR